MARRSWAFLCVVAAGALALGACSKQSEDHPSALGRPGTGNGVAMVKPSMPDSPPRSNGIPASATDAGASGGGVVAGASGNGSVAASGRPASAPGVGLDGGLGTGSAIASSKSGSGSTTSAPSDTGPDAATPGGSGSPNMTTHSSVGNR